jgi:hypothetical protein
MRMLELLVLARFDQLFFIPTIFSFFRKQPVLMRSTVLSFGSLIKVFGLDKFYHITLAFESKVGAKQSMYNPQNLGRNFSSRSVYMLSNLVAVKQNSLISSLKLRPDCF